MSQPNVHPWYIEEEEEVKHPRICEMIIFCIISSLVVFAIGYYSIEYKNAHSNRSKYVNASINFTLFEI